MARGYIKGKEVDVDLVQIDAQGHQLAIPAAVAFLKMRAAARSDLLELEINSAFRRMADQERLYKLYKSGKGYPAAKPGWSLHQSGMAVDIDVKDSRGNLKPIKAWLDKNAARYGWKATVPSEAHHFEYIGSD